VLEFFQYSCPHCFAFTPDLTAWRKHLAPDVAYARVPVAFDLRGSRIRRSTTRCRHSIAWTTCTTRFSAIHVAHRHLMDTDEIADFMAENGINKAQWLATYSSFSVMTKSNQAVQIWTPTRSTAPRRSAATASS